MLTIMVRRPLTLEQRTCIPIARRTWVSIPSATTSQVCVPRKLRLRTPRTRACELGAFHGDSKVLKANLGPKKPNDSNVRKPPVRIEFVFAPGAIYAQATLLPFILMDHIGLTPSEFGLSMLLQSGLFFGGSLTVRALMKRVSGYRLVLPGLVFIAFGAVLTFLLLWPSNPGVLRVMLPVGIYAFGIAFVVPAMSTAALAPFPSIAGAAASLMGFMQMGAGLLIGSLGSLFTNTITAFAVLIPIMALTRVR